MPPLSDFKEIIVRKKITIILPVILFLFGMAAIGYPVISNWINGLNGSYAIARLQQRLENEDDAWLEEQFLLARNYNEKLKQNTDSEKESLLEAYSGILDFGDGIMGYIHIPSIDVTLPIYHGVDARVLEKGVGHMPQSAFPIGGEGDHAVLTGHTGLPTAKLFTDLNRLQEGDVFSVTVGNRTITYVVDQIRVVLPGETEALQPIPGMDCCTLVTCTPYGINSHRLLVRGSREVVD